MSSPHFVSEPSEARRLPQCEAGEGEHRDMCAVVVGVSALASLAGYVLLDGATNDTVAFVQSFAGGAILTMLATTLMPEAFEVGGARVGIATALGLATAYAVHVFG